MHIVPGLQELFKCTLELERAADDAKRAQADAASMDTKLVTARARATADRERLEAAHAEVASLKAQLTASACALPLSTRCSYLPPLPPPAVAARCRLLWYDSPVVCAGRKERRGRARWRRSSRRSAAAPRRRRRRRRRRPPPCQTAMRAAAVAVSGMQRQPRCALHCVGR